MLPSKKITKRDILLIFFVIILGVVLMLPKSFAGKAGERVIVSCDGTVMSYSLKNDGEYSNIFRLSRQGLREKRENIPFRRVDCVHPGTSCCDSLRHG